MTKKYNSQSTIETILSVSAQMFLEKGFEKTSMQEIARTAGISKGAIYHHFKSKEEIITAVTKRQAQNNKSTLEHWITSADSMNGKDKLTAILKKNIESQEMHSMDEIMCIRMKSAEFVLTYMQDCVNDNSAYISELIKEGIADGSLKTEFPDECAEVFLLLINIWCDPAVFTCCFEKLSQRLKFLQHMMKTLGIDILSDSLLTQTLDLLKKLYPEEN